MTSYWAANSIDLGRNGMERQGASSDSLKKYYFSIFNIGEGYKEHTVGDLNTNIGQFKMAVAYRTKMTISPTQTGRDTTLMLKSDHFNDVNSKTQIRYHVKKP